MTIKPWHQIEKDWFLRLLEFHIRAGGEIGHDRVCGVHIGEPCFCARARLMPVIESRYEGMTPSVRDVLEL